MVWTSEQQPTTCVSHVGGAVSWLIPHRHQVQQPEGRPATTFNPTTQRERRIKMDIILISAFRETHIGGGGEQQARPTIHQEPETVEGQTLEKGHLNL